MSPYLQVRDDQQYPPMLLLHGTADTVVPYHQSVKMRDRLAEHGVDAQLVLVDAPNMSTIFGASRSST